MKEASNRPIPVQAENGTSPSPSPVGGVVRQPGTLYGYVRTSRQQLDRYCRKLRARRTGVPNAVGPRALSYYRKVAVSMLRRFESRYQEPS